MRVAIVTPMVDSPTTWVVAPSFFDVPSWRRLRSEVLATLSGDASATRFVLIDDSAGADAEVAQLAGEPDVEVVVVPFNLGHQRALTFGLRRVLGRAADHDVIVTLDADGEDRAEDVPLLVQRARNEAFRVALARRTSRTEHLSFRLSYIAFRVLFRIMTGRSMRTGNFAAFSVATARRILPQPQFDLSYASALAVSGAELVHIDCPRGRRYEGQPKMNRQRLVSHGLRLMMPYQEQIAIRALFVSASVALLGFVSLAAIGIVRFASDAAVPGWATYSSLIVIAISAIALSNFVVLFAIFSQSRSVALSSLERDFE